MKKIVSIILILVIGLTGCTQNVDISERNDGEITTISDENNYSIENIEASVDTDINIPNSIDSVRDNDISIEEIDDDELIIPDEIILDDPIFDSIDDPEYLQYLEDAVYFGLMEELTDGYSNEDCIIENISTVYISKDYLDELEYNSQANIWFGYTLDEVKEQFGDTPFVFTLGDSGDTVVVPFENPDDTFKTVIKNVAVGTGVILVAATATVATSMMGPNRITVILAFSTTGSVIGAVSAAAIAGIIAGTMTAINTGDKEQALKDAALYASEGFKWGAIAGAAAGTAVGTIVTGTNVGWDGAEKLAQSVYGGELQQSYLNGELVKEFTTGSTRPDLMVWQGNHWEAIEVKYCDLSRMSTLNSLVRNLRKELSDRIIHLPAGTTQKLVLVVRGRGFSQKVIEFAEKYILRKVSDIYPNLVIDILF